MRVQLAIMCLFLARDVWLLTLLLVFLGVDGYIALRPLVTQETRMNRAIPEVPNPALAHL
jgi:hypothetical protein